MPISLDFNLIEKIMHHGLTYREGSTVDPSTHPELKAAGNGLITSYIEQLSLIGLVKDPAPLFGKGGGMWIGYQLTDNGRELASQTDELRRAVARLTGGPMSEVSEAVDALIDECKKLGLRTEYRDNFLRTLEEIRICFDAECYIATLGMCGKILEVTLKEILNRNGVTVDSNTTIGGLIKLLKERVKSEYVDQTMANVARIINTNRIPAVHAIETIPIPSRDQAIMVIFAMRDVVRRNLTHSSKSS